MDDAVALPGGFGVGADALLSVVPVVGDAAAAAVSLYVVAEAWRAGVPRSALARMLLNVAADLVVGSVPFVGPVLDAALRVNRRNVDLFESAVRS